ncbi:MAG: hypothetical protein JXA73_20910 [Acidobacteria bacterium]|nr:hypothetical protein [Acidobacteriota bacterium]
MARGEVYVNCPNCGSQSRVPFIALSHDNYHCSRCGKRISLSTINPTGDNGSQPPPRPRSKKPFHRRKRH